MALQEPPPLRRGWTTGACAAAAARAAYAALLTDAFPDPVAIRRPRSQKPRFPLTLAGREGKSAREVALATLSGAAAVEVAIVDRGGGFLARAEP
jgi:cobalamin biosynthesis protein CbiD